MYSAILSEVLVENQVTVHFRKSVVIVNNMLISYVFCSIFDWSYNKMLIVLCLDVFSLMRYSLWLVHNCLL